MGLNPVEAGFPEKAVQAPLAKGAGLVGHANQGFVHAIPQKGDSPSDEEESRKQKTEGEDHRQRDESLDMGLALVIFDQGGSLGFAVAAFGAHGALEEIGEIPFFVSGGADRGA